MTSSAIASLATGSMVGEPLPAASSRSPSAAWARSGAQRHGARPRRRGQGAAARVRRRRRLPRALPRRGPARRRCRHPGHRGGLRLRRGRRRRRTSSWSSSRASRSRPCCAARAGCPSTAPLGVVAQAAAALGAAHAAGVVHRDVKPGNLLVTPGRNRQGHRLRHRPAADAAPLTRTGVVIGTAPTSRPSRPPADGGTPASDIYSLGVVAYECLPGAAVPGTTTRSRSPSRTCRTRRRRCRTTSRPSRATWSERRWPRTRRPGRLVRSELGRQAAGGAAAGSEAAASGRQRCAPPRPDRRTAGPARQRCRHRVRRTPACSPADATWRTTPGTAAGPSARAGLGTSDGAGRRPRGVRHHGPARRSRRSANSSAPKRPTRARPPPVRASSTGAPPSAGAQAPRPSRATLSSSTLSVTSGALVRSSRPRCSGRVSTSRSRKWGAAGVRVPSRQSCRPASCRPARTSP